MSAGTIALNLVAGSPAGTCRLQFAAWRAAALAGGGDPKSDHGLASPVTGN